MNHTDDRARQEAVSRIQAAERFNASRLSLSGLGLEAVPEPITHLSNLEELDLRGNRISAIPSSFGRLSNLRSLNLDSNLLANIPEVLTTLVNLHELYLGSNRIQAIPDAIDQLSNLEEIYLHDNSISIVPPTFSKLRALRILSLGHNRLRTIPEELAEMVNLRRLQLSGNQLLSIPEFLSSIDRLESLELGESQLGSIPPWILKMSHLQHLHLDTNRLTVIPESIIGLSNLTSLVLAVNEIEVIPDSIGKLLHLKLLDLSLNKISQIPDSLAHLSYLEDLFLDGNKITKIPDYFDQFTHLRRLALRGNQINAIPTSISGLSGLETLDLDENPLPEELVAALKRGISSLFRYLQSTASNKLRPRTVKLVLLGEPKSGKTTLLEALKGNPSPCDESRQETLGVEVTTVAKPHPTDSRPMYLSVWDFAGQHMEHATHQFFLTESAIYLILWNARQGTESGKRDLWYWLELLKMRVREPKFILVATHTAHTPPDLNLTEIERNYRGFQGHFSIELSNLNGVKALEAKLLNVAADSPSLNAEWPPEWLSARNEVRRIRQEKPHMTPAAFRDLLRKQNVRNPLEQKDLADQLHKLGEILYYQERDELSSLVILNPEWVTELIALVIRSKEVRDHNGILLKTDLDKLWRNAKLQSNVREHLLHLMDWFDLTYSTGDKRELGIVVEALPYSTPEFLRQIRLPEGQPSMEMIFRFPSLQRRLPPGIPTWGIARAHRFSARTPSRDAARFEDKDGNTKSQALVLASESLKEVRLKVAADYPPFFFGRMEAILRDTFKRYPGAEPEQRLPCPCRPDCTHSYLFETVVKRGKDGKQCVTCDRSGDDVAISSLLTGFPPPQTEEGRRAFESEMRRHFTELMRAANEQIEKTCPSVFTLVPVREFKQLDTWFESATQQDELELTLYCEDDSGWHATKHSLYRFRLNMEWLIALKHGWNLFVRVTKHVGPLAKAVGKAAGIMWAEISALTTERLSEISSLDIGSFAERLTQTPRPESIDIETRHSLEQLLGYLDSRRSPDQPKNGGLHPYLIEDGRLLWLCPDHLKIYKGRT
jgi:Leucine-rich repeat (LRR) protein